MPPQTHIFAKIQLMTENDFIPGPVGGLPESGSFRWEAPSNIALVKYWGKKAGQLPMNPSVSFTLDTCASRTELRFRKSESPSEIPSFMVFLEGSPAPHFREKIQSFRTGQGFDFGHTCFKHWRAPVAAETLAALDTALLCAGLSHSTTGGGQ